MKRPVRIDPDNVADGVNRLLLALGPEDARVLELSAAGLCAFADLLRRLKTPDPPPPVKPAAAEAPAGKAPPPVPPAPPGGTNPPVLEPNRTGVSPGAALRLLPLLAAGPRTAGEMARELGLVNQAVDAPLRRSPWFEKEHEGTGARNPSRWRLSPAGREALRTLGPRPAPAASSTSAASAAAGGGPPATGPATSSPSPTPGATAD